MRYPAINWTEGMFLCPQHFQAADRYWHEALRLRDESTHPYAYGLRRISYSNEALANAQIALTDCLARMRDGSVVVIAADEELRVDLGVPRTIGPTLHESLDKQDTVMAYLAVASGGPGENLVAEQGSERASMARYLRAERQSVDETTGDNQQLVQHRRLNIQVLLETDDLSGYETLPLFRIQRSASSGHPEIDTDYFPPVLAVSAWPDLGQGIMRRVFDLVDARCESLAQQVLERRVGFSSHEAGDLERMLLLRTLSEAVGTLTCDAFAEGVHPFDAYRSLCGLVGRLSIFGESRRISDPPAYDHDDLARIFQWVRLQIEQLIFDPSEDSFHQRYFVGEGPGLQVALDALWFGAGWEWYVGVRPLNLEPDVCRTLLVRGKIDWKLGSSERVDTLYSQKIVGVELSPVIAPRLLPDRENWVYFKVQRDTPAWQRLKDSSSMAIRVNQRLIQNLSKLQGERRLELNIDGRAAAFEFAVFAVAPQGS